MCNYNTIARTICTLGLIGLLSQPATAQSMLNFVVAERDATQETGITIINPNPYYADVQLTFYGLNGNLVADGPINPVSHRVEPKGRLHMNLNELFYTGLADGWIQATSTSSGLIGFYSAGDGLNSFEGAEPATPLLSQSIPLLRGDDSTRTRLRITNPGSLPANVTINLYNGRGSEIGTLIQNLVPHAGVDLRLAAALPAVGLDGGSALITASVPVIAMAIFDRDESLLFVSGQRVDQLAATRVIPHFINGNGAKSECVLTNPTTSPVTINVHLIDYSRGTRETFSQTLTIPPRGSETLNAAVLTKRVIAPMIVGWLQIDSSSVALNGLVTMESGRGWTSIPMQSTASDRLFFSEAAETTLQQTAFVFVNPSATNASAVLSVFGSDGRAMGQADVSIASQSRLRTSLKDLLPQIADLDAAFVAIRSSVGLYGVELLSGSNSSFVTSVVPTPVGFSFIPRVRPDVPRILRIDPGQTVTAGTTLRIFSSESGDPQILFGSLAVTPTLLAPGTGLMMVDVPAIEPGFVDLRLRINGTDSEPVPLKIVAPDDEGLVDVQGAAFYQKIESGNSGLDTTRTTMVPIRKARVEAIDSVSGRILSAAESDDRGKFILPVPQNSPALIRVLSRHRSSDLRVLDNTNGGAFYNITMEFDPRQSAGILLTDRTRTSGAFNILEMIQRANEMIRLTTDRITLPSPTVFWSTQNKRSKGNVSEGHIGTTFFNLTTNTAYVLGDRSSADNADSDEFDDSVILHEYAHLLAARFSRDDSPGGDHNIGEALDPRLAWSEGWANFFSGAVRNESVYRDSRGANGGTALRMDIEENQPAGDIPGYWSEAAVHSLLWDLFDSQPDASDNVQYPFNGIWDAVADLRLERFVYFPQFLERFVARVSSASDAVRGMAQARGIDFRYDVRPSVSNPFPKPIGAPETVLGQVDSVTRKRENLAQSAYFYSLTSSGQSFMIRLDILGLGTGNNPDANDLDLLMFNQNGQIFASSDSGLNGQSEIIMRRLPPGPYVIEVRSYYIKAETNLKVFNSGDFRLSITAN